jgi:hypothetical protein
VREDPPPAEWMKIDRRLLQISQVSLSGAGDRRGIAGHCPPSGETNLSAEANTEPIDNRKEFAVTIVPNGAVSYSTQIVAQMR